MSWEFFMWTTDKGERGAVGGGEELTRVSIVGNFGVLNRLVVVVEHKVVERATDRGSECQINGTLTKTRVALAAPVFRLCKESRVINH